MGGLIGHVALGLVFLFIGSWHLFNHTRLHFTHQHHYKSPLSWFPTSFSRHLELYVIMIACVILSFSELHHWPFLNPDGSIPSNLLRHLEHASMALSFLLYALFALVLDKIKPVSKPHNDIVWFLASMAFAQELLLFHFHSTDHVGVEGQYHLLLEFVVVVCLVTTLMGIRLPRSFIVSFIRSLAITVQGAWLIFMGTMLWTPGLIPKGCFIREKNGRDVIDCDGKGLVDRGKALVNILFSWALIGFAGFAALFYVAMGRFYGGFLALAEEEEKIVAEKWYKYDLGKRFVTSDSEG